MTGPSFNQIYDHFTETLARRFPVTCASDEFYYFPQIRLEAPDWTVWDDFSAESVTETVRLLSGWETALGTLPPMPTDGAAAIDCRLLKKVLRTLKEQLEIIRTWQTQPTLYLTIACVGMAEALADPDPDAKHDRAKGLPVFLESAAGNFHDVPELFYDLALAMIPDIRNYFLLLHQTVPAMGRALAALDRFEAGVKKVATESSFHYPMEIVERLVKNHIHTGRGTSEIEALLEEEIAYTRRMLNGIAAKSFPGLDWEEFIAQIPLPSVGRDGLIGLYQKQVAGLADHCVKARLVPKELVKQCPVKILPVPGYLSATRTASSYSIPSQHPSTGGTFYIYNAADPEEARRPYQREYRILCAHETWPGHHLLDVSRWNLDRPVRRVVEQPLFYEGWACFAEELMRQTGYLHTDEDLMQLFRRRLWRAIRGKVDLALQTGRIGIETAAKALGRTGMGFDRALSTVRKYTLNPGYQLCYTVGLRYFLDLFEKHGRDRPQWFTQIVRTSGELNFDDLDVILKSSD